MLKDFATPPRVPPSLPSTSVGGSKGEIAKGVDGIPAWKQQGRVEE